MADLITPTIPPGLFFVRIANFINGELFGRTTNVPWAMVFPNGGPTPRHPSQLYEAFLEGFIMFVVLWIFKDREKREGDVFAVFLMLYAVFRVFCEFFREPDTQVGYIFGIVTMGQILSIIMFALGIITMVIARVIQQGTRKK